MSIKITITSLELELNKRDIKKALRKGAGLVAREAKREIIQTAGTGITRGKHTASSPGQPPANLSGELARDLKAKSGKGLSAVVSDTAWYALALEKSSKGGGGRKGQRNRRRRGQVETQTPRVQEARPFLEPALEHERDAIIKLVADAASIGMKKK